MDNHIPEVFREFQNTIKEMNAVHTEKIGEQDTLETKMLDSEVRNDIQGFEGRDVVVFGNPIEIGENLIIYREITLILREEIAGLCLQLTF